jgi:hypothetical protein
MSEVPLCTQAGVAVELPPWAPPQAVPQLPPASSHTTDGLPPRAAPQRPPQRGEQPPPRAERPPLQSGELLQAESRPEAPRRAHDSSGGSPFMPPAAPPRGVHGAGSMPDNGAARNGGAPPPLPGEWNPAPSQAQPGGQQGGMLPPAPQLLSATGVLKVRPRP